ncbi:MAG: hypothetical protein LBD52_02235, partial [Prevotellaceae bacterium]|nr:hypothetical protein [Prevotellaceae bacterium]
MDVVQQPCAGVADGIVEVTVKRGDNKVFYFWWPSREGNRDEIEKDAACTSPDWHKVENPGTTTIVLSEATSNYGFGTGDYELIVRSRNESLTQSLPLTSYITELPTFAPGTLTAYNEAICTGTTVPLIESAAPSVGGAGGYTYQWYVSTDNGTSFTSISGATLTTYTATVTAPGTYIFKRLDADSLCAKGGVYADGEAKLLIAERPEVTIDSPASSTICDGMTPGTFTTTVTKGLPGATYTYVWEAYVSDLGWAGLPLTSSTYAPQKLSNSMKFRVKITNGGAGCSSANYSPELFITVHPAFNPGAVLSTSGDTWVNVQPAAISAGNLPSAGSGSYTYQWYKNSALISGATLTTYQPTMEDVKVVGSITYTREVADVICGGTTVTRQHILAVGKNRTVNLTPAVDTAVCNDASFTITSDVIAGGAYTWYDSTATGTWQQITGAPNSNILPVAGKTAADTYYYKVVIVSDDYYPGEVILSANLAKVQVWDVLNPGSFTSGTDGTCPGVAPGPINSTRVTEATGGSGTYTYQWYKKHVNDPDGSPIDGATAATYQPLGKDTEAGSSVTYWRMVADNACQALPQPAAGSYIVHIGGDKLLETITPANFAVCDGGTITITAPDRGAASATTYTWYQSANGKTYQNIKDQNSNILKVEAPSPAGTYYYKINVNVKDGACNLVFNSEPATVTVYQPYVKGNISGIGNTCVNAIAPAAITGTAPTGGDGNYSYQWFKEAVEIPGATAESYTPRAEDLQTQGTINYVRKEKDGASCAGADWIESGTYTLTVKASPTIALSTPTVLTICHGGSFTLKVDAPSEGSPKKYEWEHNDGSGWAATGTDNAVLTVTNGPTVAGLHYYRVKVTVTTTDCEVLLTSNETVITVNEAFSPGSFLVSEGTACTGKQPQAITGVSEPTGGSGNYAYKWFENLTTEVGTAATYQPGAIATPGVKVYSRQVADQTCNTGYLPTTGLFVLTVGSGTPTIDIVSVKSTICGGGNVTLTAGTVAGGTYTWESSSDGSIWTTRTESKTNTITLPGGMAKGDYYYKVSVATNDAACSKYISTPATVTVREAFNPGVFQVTAGNICPDATPAAITGITDATGGDGNYSYQWYQDNNLIPGATAATYQPGKFSSATTAVYTRSAKDGSCGAGVLAGSYTLTVNASATSTINLEPAAQEVCYNTAFTVTSGEPAGALGYTWFGSANGVDWENIIGPNSKTLDVAGTTVTGTRYYKVEVLTDGTCSGVVISAPATVTLRKPFTAGEFVVTEGGVCVGEQPAAITGMTDPTGGSGSYTYKWLKNGGELNVNTATYQPPVSDAATPGKIFYTRMAADATCNTGWVETTGTYTLNAGGIPTTDIVPAQIAVCNNSPSTLTAGLVTGVYTWQKSDDGASWTTFGTDSRSVAIPAIAVAGDYYYRVTVTTNGVAGCNNFVSTPSTVTVREAFKPGVFQVTAGNICPDATPAAITGVTDPTGGDGNYSYQWYQGGSPIPGATAATYQPGTFPSATTAVYTRGAKDGSCSAEVLAGSYTLTVDASATSTVNIVPAAQEACNGTAFTVTSGIPANATAYTWEEGDGTAWTEVTGTDNVLNVATGKTKAGDYYYRVTVQTGNTCSPAVTSTPATVTVRAAFSAGEISAGASICAG